MRLQYVCNFSVLMLQNQLNSNKNDPYAQNVCRLFSNSQNNFFFLVFCGHKSIITNVSHPSIISCMYVPLIVCVYLLLLNENPNPRCTKQENQMFNEVNLKNQIHCDKGLYVLALQHTNTRYRYALCFKQMFSLRFKKTCMQQKTNQII